MAVEKKDGTPGEAGETPPAPVVTTQDIVAEISARNSELEAAIAKQKATGEITAASESTLQALYEELKSARKDLADIKAMGVREIPVASVPSKWARWLPW